MPHEWQRCCSCARGELLKGQHNKQEGRVNIWLQYFGMVLASSNEVAPVLVCYKPGVDEEHLGHNAAFFGAVWLGTHRAIPDLKKRFGNDTL
eukprot:1138786-Pelagomonas_calceolata.AAC.1